MTLLSIVLESVLIAAGLLAVSVGNTLRRNAIVWDEAVAHTFASLIMASGAVLLLALL